MGMDESTRTGLVLAFDGIRASFLATIDQIVAELRPTLLTVPGYYDGSVRACAAAFADPELVRSQLLAISPEVGELMDAEEIADIHLITLAYLFSLSIHETIRNHQELPK